MYVSAMKNGQPTRTLNFVVLEDHPLVRSAIIRDVLHQLGKVQVLYEGASLAEALDTARTADVDCAVLDLDLGDDTLKESHEPQARQREGRQRCRAGVDLQRPDPTVRRISRR